MSQAPQYQSSLSQPTKSQLLVSCGMARLLSSRLIKTSQNQSWHRRLSRYVEEILIRVHSPSNLLFPHLKLFFQGSFHYHRGQFLQAVSCFSYASEFQIGEAFYWMSMMYLGGRSTIQQNTELAVSYLKKAEKLCPQKKRVVFDMDFMRVVSASTLEMVPELVVYRDTEIIFTPPFGIDPDLQVFVDQNGKIRISHGERKFRQYEGRTTKDVLNNGISFYDCGLYGEAWVCFYLLTKLNEIIGFSWIACLYYYGYGVRKCNQTGNRCRYKVALTDDKDVREGLEITLVRHLWERHEFDLEGWFCILSRLLGGYSPLDEILYLRSAEKATAELERARAFIVCSNYQQAEWHYHLAVFYGSDIAKAEVESMRELIHDLQYD